MTKDRINKSSKRENLVKNVVFDVKLDRQKLNGNKGWLSKKKNEKGLKRTTKSVEVTTTKLIGHYTTDIYGKNLVMDEPLGIRVYCLPAETQQHSVNIVDSSDDEGVVDDWEQLAENMFLSSPSPEVLITDCDELNFDLLKGYIPMKDGGNAVGFTKNVRDRTACMRWMAKHHQELKCKDSNRLFDVDFLAGNGTIRKVMTSQFDFFAEESHLAVILLMGTYHMWDVTPSKNDDELNNKRSFAGLRFEDFVSRGIDGSENEPSNGDKNNYTDATKYYNVVKLDFAGYRLIVAGEVDCVIPGSSAANGSTPKADDFIEIKTSAPLENKYYPSQMSQIFRSSKTISWFAQCILMGVKHVVVGIREEDGDQMICKKTQAFTLEELRNSSDGSWSKNRCFDALKKFLSFVKEKVTDDNPEIINVFIVKEGVISEPIKKSVSEDTNFQEIPEILDLYKNLNL